MAIRPTSQWLLLVAAAALASCGADGDAGGEQNGAAPDAVAGEAEGGDAAAEGTLAQGVVRAADQSVFVEALRAAGLESTLAGPGPYTVFVPVDAAFAKLPQGTVEALMKPEEKARLTGILTYHIVPGAVTVEDLARAAEAAGGVAQLATLGGGNLSVTASDGGVIIADAKGGQARVVRADEVHSNGVIHALDAVLMPS